VAGDLSNQDLEDAGILVTTDAQALGDQLLRKRPRGVVQVVISTYNSLPVVSAAQKGRRTEAQFDVAIADEAHHTAGRISDRKQARAFQALLDNRDIRAARRIFATATPRVIEPRRRRRGGVVKSFGMSEKDYFSMDDRSVYGEIFYELTLAQAIESPEVHVAPYRVVPHFVRKSDLDFLRDPRSGLPYQLMSEDEACAAYVLEDLMDRMPELGASRVITYHDRKSKAALFQRTFAALNAHRPGLTRFAAQYLDGDMPIAQRNEVLASFSASQAEHGVLSNCKALTEGVNVSGANSLLFADPKGSVIEVMQAIGRILRSEAADDKVGTVVIPLMVDDRDVERPVVDPDSILRLERILAAGKLVDAKIATRIWIPEEPAHPHPLNPCGAPDLASSRFHRLAHIGRGWISHNRVAEVVAEALEEIRFLSGRDYFGTSFNERTGKWEAEVENPWYDALQSHPDPARWGSGPRIRLGTDFEDSEAAALAVDAFIRDAGLSWQTNFGHNPHRAEDEERSNITSRFPNSISYSPARSAGSRWRAYVDLLVPDENGNLKPGKPGRYFATEAEAIQAHDALVRRYEAPGRMLEPDAPARFDLILNRQYAVEEGIEREFWWQHVPGKQFWAYVRDEKGIVHPAGYAGTLEEARALRSALLQEMAEERAALASALTHERLLGIVACPDGGPEQADPAAGPVVQDVAASSRTRRSHGR
jgi:hypothetical protein